MRFWINLFLVFCSFYGAVGQAQVKVDSLLQLLQTYDGDDQGKVDLLNLIGYEYWIVAPAQSEIYGARALDLALNISYESGEAFAQPCSRCFTLGPWQLR